MPIKTVGDGVSGGVAVGAIVGSAVLAAVACGGFVGCVGGEVGGTAVGGTGVAGLGVRVRVGMVCAACVMVGVASTRMVMLTNNPVIIRNMEIERKLNMKPLKNYNLPHFCAEMLLNLQWKPHYAF